MLFSIAIAPQEEIVSRKAVVDVIGERNDTIFEDSNLLKMTHCLCVSPPVSEYLDCLSQYQMELRNVIEFFKTLDGKVFEGKQIQFSVKTEPSLTEVEADAWCQLWSKLVKRY